MRGLPGAWARRVYQSNRITGNIFRDGHATYHLVKPQDIFAGEQWIDRLRSTAGCIENDLELVVVGQVVDEDVEHESIELCLRQWISPFHLDRILSCQHKKGLWQFHIACPAAVTWCFCIASNSAALGFPRSPIDFVRQDHVCKHRPWTNCNVRRPSTSSKISVPVMSAGIKSGVN